MQKTGFLKKTTALAVIFCFAVLLQVSVQPLNAVAAAGPDYSAKAGGDEGQGLLEVEDDGSRSYARKSSMTPIIIGLLAAGAVAAVLFLVVLKSYDITGTWTLNYKWQSMSSFSSATLTFTGTKKSGTMTSGTTSAVYTVDGKKVQWAYTTGPAVYVGTFSDKNTMSGTMSTSTLNGEWNATRAAGSSNIGNSVLKNGIKADGSQ